MRSCKKGHFKAFFKGTTWPKFHAVKLHEHDNDNCWWLFHLVFCKAMSIRSYMSPDINLFPFYWTIQFISAVCCMSTRLHCVLVFHCMTGSLQRWFATIILILSNRHHKHALSMRKITHFTCCWYDMLPSKELWLEISGSAPAKRVSTYWSDRGDRGGREGAVGLVQMEV